MNLQQCLFLCVLNILGSRAAPYLDAYLNPERSEFDPGAGLNPGMDFQMGNWTMDYNNTSKFEVEVSASPELLEKGPAHVITYKEEEQRELFLFSPAKEDVCFIKDLDDKENKTKVRRRKNCNDTDDTPIPEQIKLSLPVKYRSLPVKWLDEFFCDNNIKPDPQILSKHCDLSLVINGSVTTNQR